VNQRGRKSAAALAVVDEACSAGISVPPGLTAGERVVWMTTVSSKPADWFGSEHVPILVEYVRCVCRAQVIDRQIKAFDDDWLATAEGLVRFEKLTAIAIKTAGMINRLATAMRLTQQATILADKVIPKPGSRLWQREKQQSST
jgi:hypothetical protein